MHVSNQVQSNFLAHFESYPLIKCLPLHLSILFIPPPQFPSPTFKTHMGS